MSVITKLPVFQMQAVATLVQAAPVQNTWYTVLDTKRNVRVLMISFEVLTTGETLEVKMTIDGQTYTWTQAAGAGTDYWCNISLVPTALSLTVLSSAVPLGSAGANQGAFVVEGRSVKVEIRKTTNAGAGTIDAAVLYGKVP